jgi:serine/threonine protein kinase/tetratricopeptide (TPR) repeat protein
MTLQPGSRVGPYEIEHALGAGGMGEVYRARDARLERSVAIKALPAAFLGDAERLARFEREARLLAALNHPNIATIHGLETADGLPHLVLELIDGETLAARLSRGALSVREAVELGLQVASAIEAAHDKGIVHRDLKPANVMITKDGRVKVLDFGLARGDAPKPVDSASLSASPTLAVSATAAGVILGTAPYMSPEQARGLEVDRRTDIWALGCLLFEGLTGRSTFAADTVSDVIARILERDPDWNQLPPGTPPRLRDLIKRCLTKAAADRPRDIGDLRKELGSIATEMTSGSGIRPVSEKPSLAVLYFENLSSDEESGYFCAGITEDILTDLSKIKGLKVASRNAVARYRGQTVDPARVGADLGVKAILEGSVRRAGDRVRISAQLINAADGFQLWAERYDRQMADVFQVQEEIASAIAEALKVALTPAEEAAIGRDRPNDVKAYDLYLKGRQAYALYSRESLTEALACFEEAIALEPNYALAWAGKADTLAQMFGYRVADDPVQALRQAEEAARRAIAFNPMQAEGHKALALALRFAGDQAGADASLRRAVEVNPRYTPAMINLAVDMFDRADLAGAERQFRRVLSIDPEENFATSWLAALLSLVGRHDESWALYDRIAKKNDSQMYQTIAFSARFFLRLQQNDMTGAGAVLDEATAGRCTPAVLTIMRICLDYRSGRLDEARAAFADLGDPTNLTLYGGILLTEVQIALGDWEAAMRTALRPVWKSEMPTTIRLYGPLNPLADREPFAPRRSPSTLIWPLEAPMMSAQVHALFREVKIESGRGESSETSASRRG